MNQNLKKLYGIGKKDTRYIIGLMSGTSLDGLDVALCKIKGSGVSTSLSLLKFITINYDEDFKEEIKTIFSKKIIDLEKLCLLHEWIGSRHAAIVNECLQNWNIARDEIDLIASHGQTIYHAPLYLHQNKKFGNATLQIGDGDHIAVNTGIITISDFRQRHIAAGGEGAPLAVYGDFILFSETENDIILLNIGGIANFTYLPAGAGFNNIICSDIGPGNTMIDAYVQKHFPGKYFDENAGIAKQGNVHDSLLCLLKKHDFFTRAFPKTTGPESFNITWLENVIDQSGLAALSHADILATLHQFSASTICDAINSLSTGKNNSKVLVSGGGMHNPLLMEYIRKNINGISVYSTMEKNIEPDAKEAVLFAILANECVAGNGYTLGDGAEHFPSITMGKISFPN